MSAFDDALNEELAAKARATLAPPVTPLPAPSPLAEPLEAPSPPPAPRSALDDALDAEAGARQQIRGSAIRTREIPPEKMAEALRLERTTGVPAMVVVDNLADVGFRARLRELDLVHQKSPVLAGMIRRSPEFAALAQDDLVALAQAEELVKTAGFKPASEKLRAAQDRNARRRDQATGYAQGYYDSTPAGVDHPYPSDLYRDMFVPPGQRGAPQVPFDPIARAARAMRSFTGEDRTVGEIYGHLATAPWRGLWASRAAAPGLVALAAETGAQALEEGLGVPAPRLRALGAWAMAEAEGIRYRSAAKSALAGKGAGFVERSVAQGLESFGMNAPNLALAPLGAAAVLAPMGATSVGLAYPTARGDGLDPLRSALYASVQGGIEVLTEAHPALQLVKDLKVGAPFVKTLGRAMVNESFGEQIARHGQDFVDWISLESNQDKTLVEFLKERPGAAVETAIATIAAVGLQTSLAGSVNALVNRRVRAEQAKVNADALQRITEIATASKVRERSTENFQAFVDSAAEETGSEIREVYVEGALLQQVLQQAGVEIPESAAAQLATDPAGLVRLSIGEFAARIAPTEAAKALIPHLKLNDPAAMSMEEATTLLQEGIDDAQRAIEEQGADQTFRDASAAVNAELTSRLNQVGRFRDSVNRDYIVGNLGAFYTTLANRLRKSGDEQYKNVTAQDLLKQFPIRFEGEALPGETLDQRVDPRQLLRDIAAASEAAARANGAPHPSAMGAEGGLFGGSEEGLTVDANGDVVLVRFANDEGHLTKNWKAATLQELIDASITHGGSQQSGALPTSSKASWNTSYGQGNQAGLKATFKIPAADLVRLVKEGKATLGNLGEGEILLSGEIAQQYLHSVEGQNAAEIAERLVSARLFQPGNDIGHRREKSTGRYVGAPDWVGADTKMLRKLQRNLKKLAIEGVAGRYWYEKSGRAVLDLVGGNKEEAEKFVALLAIYSQGTDVSANTTFALVAYYQWKAGLPIHSGRFPTAQSKKAEKILRENEGWSGVKTNNFYNDLMEEIDPSKTDQAHATMDMWMALAFDYGSDKLDQGPKYHFAKREIIRLAAELGLKPHQVQAQIWTAIKARVESTEKLRREIEAREKIEPGSYEHFRLATRLGMEAKITPEEIAATDYDFSTALQERMVQMSWEATPSTGAGRALPGIHAATTEQKLEYLVAMQKAIGNEILEMAGLPPAPTLNGISAWGGALGAGAQTMVPAPSEGVGKTRALREIPREALDLWASITGLVLEQDAVAYHTPVWTDAKERHNGVQLTTKRPLTEGEMGVLYGALQAQFATTDLAPIYRPDGARVLNFVEGLSNKEFQKGVDKVISSLPEDFGGGFVSHAGFRSDGNLLTNNWQESPNGEEYKSRIEARRPDLLGRVASLRARAQAVNAEFARRYGWDRITLRQEPAGERQSGVRGAAPEGRGGAVEAGRGEGRPGGAQALGFSAKPRHPQAVSARAVHYSNTGGLTALDPRKAGTASAGGERRRFGMGNFGARGGTAARLYFYVQEEGAGTPEAESAVLGRHSYSAQLDNLYDYAADPLGLRAKARVNADYLEELVSEAGFDGILWPPVAGIPHRTAIVFDVGDAQVPVTAAAVYEQEGVLTDQEMEDRFWDQILDDPEAAIAEYLAQNTAPDGSIMLSVDNARELSADYRADRSRSAPVHEPASYLVKELVWPLALKTKNGARALFTSGGTGAGKSSGAKADTEFFALTYDGNLQSFSSAVKRIDEALAHERVVLVRSVYRDAFEAFQLGVLPRARNTGDQGEWSGRMVPIESHLSTHQGAMETAAKLAEHYKDDPRVRFEFIDNSRGRGNAVAVSTEQFLALTGAIDYNGLEERLKVFLAEEFEKGNVPEKVYRTGISTRPSEEEDQGRSPLERAVARRAARPNQALAGGVQRVGEEQQAGGAAPGSPLGQPARGQISFGPEITRGATISLLAGADLSTVLHETGHFYLEVLNHLAVQGVPGITQDMDTFLKWAGVPGATPEERLAEWNFMGLEEKRPFHEKFAKGFELYLWEGKAPSIELTGVFERFKAWLSNVYANIRETLGVQLTDEVRGVFDRLLASEEQIRQAELVRNMLPLFTDQKQAEELGLAWAEYQEDANAATQTAIRDLQSRSLRDMQWLTNARSRTLKGLQRAAKSKRAEVQAEVTAEVTRQRIYAVQEFLRTGKGFAPDGTEIDADQMLGSHKISIAVLERLYPESNLGNPQWRNLGTGRKGLMARDGVEPGVVASMFGFRDADDMVRQILAAQPLAVVVEGLTDQRMLERFGDLSSPAALERATSAAVHNAARARFVATEFAALHKAMNPRARTPAGGSVNVLLRAAKDYARKVIGGKKIRDLRPAKYEAAEARAARAAEKAFKAGKTAEAYTEKRNQLLNLQTARAAGKAADEIERGLRYLKKFGNESTRKALDPDYRDQIDQLLERFDLRQVSRKAAEKRAALADWIADQEAQGLTPVIDPALRKESERRPYKELTVDEFRGLVESIKNIEHLARLKHKLLTARDKAQFQAAVDAIVGAIETNATRTVPERRVSDRGALVSVGALFRTFTAAHRKFASFVQEMDGHKDGGTVWGYLVRAMNDAGNFEATRNEQATLKLGEMLKALGRKGMRNRYTLRGTNKSFTREERIGILLNMGNATNVERVLTGEKITPDQLRELLGTLTAADAAFANSVWEYFDSFRPEMAAKEKRVTGTTPEWVEAEPFELQLADGTTVKMRGGYYPIAYDPVRSEKAHQNIQAEVQRQIEHGIFVRTQTRRGHLQARAESTGRPLRYDFGGVIAQHLNQVIHDLAWHEYLLDANRLLRSTQVADAIIRHHGQETLHEMQDTLRDVAVGGLAVSDAAAPVLDHLRYGTTIVGLGWNVSNTLINLTGITQSIVRIGPQWVARGAAHWAGDLTHSGRALDKIYSKSEFMRLRGKTLNRELNEIRNQVTGKSTKFAAAMFWMQNRTQLVVDVPTWWGAYEKAMAQPGADEQTAIALADQAVQDAQGSGLLHTQSGIQRGSSALKMLTVFYSFFNTTFNLTSRSYNRTNFRRPADALLFAVDMVMLYTVPALLGTIIKAALAGDWDDEEKLAKKLVADQINFLFATVVGVREISAGASALAGVDPGFGYTGPAGFRTFNELIKLGQQAGQGEADAAFWKTLNSVSGILLHYPAGQINRTVEGAFALSEGETDNPGVLLVGPPK